MMNLQKLAMSWNWKNTNDIEKTTVYRMVSKCFDGSFR